MPDETRVFPRSSAFEALLAKVYMELWDLQDNPEMFARRVEKFACVFLPSMFQTKVADEFPDFEQRLKEMEAEINKLKQVKVGTDPFTQEAIEKGNIPAEKADFAEEVWHVIVDILTEAGFNFPMARKIERRKMRS